MKELIKKLQTYLVTNNGICNKNSKNKSFNLFKTVYQPYYQKIIKNCNFMMNEKDVILDKNVINSFLLPEIIKIDNFDDLCKIVDQVNMSQQYICKWISFEEHIVCFKNDYRNTKIIINNYGDINNLIDDIQYYYSNDVYTIEHQEFYDYYLKYINHTNYCYQTLKLMFIKLLNNSIETDINKELIKDLSMKELNQFLIDAYRKLKIFVNIPSYQYKINKNKLEQFQFINKLDLLYYTKEDEIKFDIIIDRLLYVLKIYNEQTDTCFIKFIKKFASTTKNNFSNYLFRCSKKYLLVF